MTVPLPTELGATVSVGIGPELPILSVDYTPVMNLPPSWSLTVDVSAELDRRAVTGPDGKRWVTLDAGPMAWAETVVTWPNGGPVRGRGLLRMNGVTQQMGEPPAAVVEFCPAEP